MLYIAELTHLSPIQGVCVLTDLCCSILICECQEAKASRSACVFVSACESRIRWSLSKCAWSALFMLRISTSQGQPELTEQVCACV